MRQYSQQHAPPGQPTFIPHLSSEFAPSLIQDGTVQPDFYASFSRGCSDFEVELVEFDGEDDHVHLLIAQG